MKHKKTEIDSKKLPYFLCQRPIFEEIMIEKYDMIKKLAYFNFYF
jgi:hypothetical protein